MTTTTGRTSNPLSALKPLVVIDTNEHACAVVLGVDSVTLEQRDAAIKHLNKVFGSTGFKLDASTTGGRYRLTGNTKDYTGSPEFHADVENGVQPEFLMQGELTLTIVREKTRHMVGVEGVIAVVGRGVTRTLPKLEGNPSEVIGLVHSGTSIVFSLKNLVKDVDGTPKMVTDAELIRDALSVAKQHGVYVDQVPTRVDDADPRARLYPRFNLPEAGGEG